MNKILCLQLKFTNFEMTWIFWKCLLWIFSLTSCYLVKGCLITFSVFPWLRSWGHISETSKISATQWLLKLKIIFQYVFFYWIFWKIAWKEKVKFLLAKEAAPYQENIFWFFCCLVFVPSVLFAFVCLFCCCCCLLRVGKKWKSTRPWTSEERLFMSVPNP